MLALEMPVKNWVVCGDSIQQALGFCVKREEHRKTAQEIKGNLRTCENLIMMIDFLIILGQIM